MSYFYAEELLIGDYLNYVFFMKTHVAVELTLCPTNHHETNYLCGFIYFSWVSIFVVGGIKTFLSILEFVVCGAKLFKLKKKIN